MAGVNKVIIVGNLGQDPEVRYTQQGAAIANISVATSETWKDKNTGEQQEKTEWHRIVMFNRLGEIAGEYLTKGSKVYVEGKLQTRKWQDQQGQDRYSTEIVAEKMQMLSDRQNQSGAAYGGGSQPPQSPNVPQNRGGLQRGSQQTPHPPSQQPSPDFDDDIPF